MAVLFTILEKKILATGIHEFKVQAPLVAKRAQAGNFVMVRLREGSERIPLTIAGHDLQTGSITLVVQEVGKSTRDIGALQVGDYFSDLVGPLGTPVEIATTDSLLAICGGIGVAPLLPILSAYFKRGTSITTIVGARSKELMVLTSEVEALSKQVIYVTDDGSYGLPGLVTDALHNLLATKANFSGAVAIGPVGMMQAVCEITRCHDLPTTVSLNAIMVDGTGMCGACRVNVNGEIRFTCLDGPAFDGHQVDFDELILRQSFYRDEERIINRVSQHGEGGCQCHAH